MIVALLVDAWVFVRVAPGQRSAARPSAVVPGPPASGASLVAALAVASMAGSYGTEALAAALPGPDLTPETFRPVCPTSDGLYSVGKGIGDALLGAEGAEYRPLVIEVLLRFRLEVCVLESFVYEAIVPFIQKNGIGWILPLHETIDTVIAGTVFAVALNFILFGTTKIVSVIAIYHDFIVGAPLRLIGYAVFPQRRAPEPAPLIQINWPGQEVPAPVAEDEEAEVVREPPLVPLAVFGGLCKGYGIFAEVVKGFFEGLDTFVGRYLAFGSIFYVAFKWAHFRLFNDFPPL